MSARWRAAILCVLGITAGSAGLGVSLPLLAQDSSSCPLTLKQQVDSVIDRLSLKIRRIPAIRAGARKPNERQLMPAAFLRGLRDERTNNAISVIKRRTTRTRVAHRVTVI